MRSTPTSCLGFFCSSLTQGRPPASRSQAWGETELALAVLSTAAGVNSVMGPECPPGVALEATQGSSVLAVLPALYFQDPLTHSGDDQFYEKRDVIPQLQHLKHHVTVLQPRLALGAWTP